MDDTPFAAEPDVGAAFLRSRGLTRTVNRFYGGLPTSSPILKAVCLSLIALIVATILVEVPPRLLTTTNTAPRYVLIAAAFNTLRFLALGPTIGSLHDRTQKADPEKPPTSAAQPARVQAFAESAAV